LGKILPKNPLRIWLPEVSKGSDFFTLLLLLEMDKLLENSKIIISDQCFINLENCKKGNIDNSIIENSFSNFKRFSPNSDITKYVVQEGKKYQIKKELLKNIFTLRGSFMEIKLPYKPNLVLFRNRLIYYNHVKEQKAINQLYETMAAGGFLITGVKENISMFEIDKKFRIYQQEEQIYKRNF
jgi:chemotaxis methyl-accepting protein methylase